VAGNRRFEIPKECRTFGETSAFSKREQVARDFVNAFVERVAPSKSLDDSNEEWTRAVRGRFIDICPPDCCAVPKELCTTKGEFLVDYIWEEKENGRRLLLAGESEWGADRFGRTHWYLVEEDFEKLLAVKAILKVLIFSSDYKLPESHGAVEADFSIEFANKRIETSLKNYGHHLPGEIYILIDFPRTGDKDSPGVFRSFIWLSKEFGGMEVELKAGPDGELIRP
jgi:hypothetical protein